nr:immunoglobulin light chain junction region [Mus musculus]
CALWYSNHFWVF